MTAMATATGTTNSESHSESVVAPRPKWSEVKRAVRDEAEESGVLCTRRKADWFIGMLIRAAKHARRHNYRKPYLLTQDELWGLHGVLRTVMPDDVMIPEPGSAHELIQRRLLLGRELAIVHTRDGANSCVLAIHVDTT